MADLSTLDNRLTPWAKYLYQLGKQYDGRLVVTSARRSPAKQARLYADWKRGVSEIPAAPPGRSLHEHGLAFDMARIGIDPLTDPLLAWLGAVWEHWGGRWGGIRDPVHFQPRI
jgi:hypothetical protein